MMKEDRLTRLYQDGLGVPEVNKELSAIAKQISHQYPSMKILEIGAGTGGMTHEVLREIDGAFSSYTFTDISTGFFEKSQERLQTVGMGRMIFSALDIEKDPAAQGYALGSYDVIIASNVLHATRKLGETMANVRQLLRPGGYLLLNEVTGEMLRLRFIMSGLPGWWLGADDGRRFAPTITPLNGTKLCVTLDFLVSTPSYRTSTPLRSSRYPSWSLKRLTRWSTSCGRHFSPHTWRQKLMNYSS
jgi:2-polyprenyl-3-methyl-5-hydroxy-6-metoxy-1,4-benzoquinol methylase